MQTLALGTSKGNVVLYNHAQRRKVPIMGKHTRSVTCGAWSVGGLLALAGKDNQVGCDEAHRPGAPKSRPSAQHFAGASWVWQGAGGLTGLAGRNNEVSCGKKRCLFKSPRQGW